MSGREELGTGKPARAPSRHRDSDPPTADPPTSDPPTSDPPTADPPDASPPTGGRARAWQRSAAPILLTVAGLIAGSIGMRVWDDQQARSRQQARVSVLVAINASGFSAGGSAHQVMLSGSLNVINSGPLPIELGRVAGSGSGVTLTGDASARPVPAGSLTTVQVNMTAPCRPDGLLPPDPLPLTLTVRTQDGLARTVTAPLQLRGTAWDGQGCPVT